MLKEIYHILINNLTNQKHASIPKDSQGSLAKNHTSNLKQLSRLIEYITPFGKKVVVAATLLIFSALLSIPQPLFTKYIIDDVIIAKNLRMLFIVIAILGVLVLTEAASSFIKNYLFLRFE